MPNSNITIRVGERNLIKLRPHAEIFAFYQEKDQRYLITLVGNCGSRLGLFTLKGDKCIRLYKGHHHAIKCLTTYQTADKQTIIVSGDKEGILCCWNAATAKLLYTIQAHTELVNCITIDLTAQDAIIVSGSADRTIRLWDAETGQPLLNSQGQPLILQGHRNEISCVTIYEQKEPRANPDHSTTTITKRIIVSGSFDHTIRLWDAATGELLRILAGHTHNVNCVATYQTTESTVIVSGSCDMTVRLWDAATGILICTSQQHTNRVSCLAVYQNARGFVIVAGNWDNILLCSDANNQQLLHTLQGEPNQSATHIITYSTTEGNTSIAASDTNGNLRCWNATTGQARLNEYSILTDNGHIFTCVTSYQEQQADGTTKIIIVSGSSDYTVRLWDAATGELLRILAGHTDFVNCVATYQTAESTIIVSGSSDYTVCLWDAATGALLRPPLGHPKKVMSLTTYQEQQADGTTKIIIVSGSVGHMVCLWDATTGALLRTFVGNHDVGPIHLTTYQEQQADGTTKIIIVTTNQKNGLLCCWDAETGRILRVLHGPIPGVCHVNSYQTATGTIIVASGGDYVFYWSAATGQLLRVLHGSGLITYISTYQTIDGPVVLSGTFDNKLYCWNGKSGDLIFNLVGMPNPLRHIAVHEKQMIVITHDSWATLKLDLEVPSLQQLTIAEMKKWQNNPFFPTAKSRLWQINPQIAPTVKQSIAKHLLSKRLVF